ncbi:MAG: glucose-6-phosphate 1-dehydrogenase [Saprospiraceae bacterium]|jgi:glucose-6-phosphate 1-dehydrogenase
MDNVIFVIFGASGDLAVRKLIPALYELYIGNFLPEEFAILGVSRSAFTDDEFREKVFYTSEFIESKERAELDNSDFTSRLSYISLQTSDTESYGSLKKALMDLDDKFSIGGNYIYYLSTPPFLYETIPACLAAHNLNDQSKGWKRLVIEKPFGYDLKTAIELNKSVREYFDEDQIYRIDHYLGKETVQNLLVTRFANGIFEPLWNRNYIKNVQITNAEHLVVGDRAGYYDKSGALRDMFQNHLMQIIAHIGMEPPIAATAESIRDEKLKLLKSIRPLSPEDVKRDVIRGQYLPTTIDNKKLKGYREEKGVPEGSKTETFVALKFFIDNWRWADVPFYVRSGKGLPTKVTEVVITFKHPPHTLFRKEEMLKNFHNELVIRIQPDEGLMLKFGMKVPGSGFHVKDVAMDFHYSDLTDTDVPAAYERLLLDVIKGDATLYARGDSVEEAWRFVAPILETWESAPSVPVKGYPIGSWGPQLAIDLTEDTWRNSCSELSYECENLELK